jgi:hypothetical protein
MKITASGISKFHFWGTYSQSFFLHFETAEDAALALPILRQLVLSFSGNDVQGQAVRPVGWVSDKAACCGVFASGDDVARVEAQLVALGADPEKISSMKYSCDSGERFSVTFDLEDPAQVLLPV